MIVSGIILAALVIVGSILYCHDRMTRQELETPVEVQEEAQQECCGMHITCEKDSLLAAVSDKIEYYDDEELDRFSGRQADGYDQSEADEFRDVLLTLLPADIAGWARSLQLRGINLPADVREELLLIVSEARQHL